MNITEQFLTDNQRRYVLEWITDSYYLDRFGLGRKAFNVTFKDKDIPPLLQPFKSDEYNMYHMVAIVTEERGAIDNHIDEELVNYFEQLANIKIKHPNTLIYYADISENMEGGELVLNEMAITPKTNMLVELEPKTPHSVMEITNTDRPRITLVCERYKLLQLTYDMLETPIYARG